MKLEVVDMGVLEWCEYNLEELLDKFNNLLYILKKKELLSDREYIDLKV